MKIKVLNTSLDKVMALSRPKRKTPKTPSWLFRAVLFVLSLPAVLKCRVKFQYHGMEKLDKSEPCMILMNHSCFLDLKIAAVLFAKRPFNIVCTSDGFIGKGWLMHQLGCIPTQKFVSDPALVRDIRHALHKNRCSVLMYPEASYSFDGTATPLPDSIGKLMKMMHVPLVTVITNGAFAHDPLYNGLQLRKVKVSADVTYLLSPAEIADMTPEQINDRLSEVFAFDNFAWQAENNVKISEPFRADGLNRVLYKCPHCQTEGELVGKGVTLHCKSCGVTYELTENGKLSADNAVFTHVPDWYAWERQCVREELEAGTYRLETAVDICAVVNYKAVYRVGSGTLLHDMDGFHLNGCDGLLDYHQSPLSSYGLYADYFWYEIGDMICIGDKNCLYYCFPKDGTDIVAKTCLAAEELYKMKKTAKVK